MPRSSRLKLPQFMADMVELAEKAITERLHVEEAAARDVALHIAASTCARNAKSMIYIPEAAAIELQRRNEGIRLEFQAETLAGCSAGKYTAGRANHLANVYGLSIQQIHSILRSVGELRGGSASGDEGRKMDRGTAQPDPSAQQFSPAQLAALNRMHDDTVQRITHVIRTPAVTPAAVPGECPAASPASTDPATE